MPPKHRTPLQYTLRDWREVLARTFRSVNNDRIALASAGVAFYALLAIFPGLAAAVSLWGLIAEPEDISRQLSQFWGIFPVDVLQVLRDQAIEIAGARTGTVGTALVLSLALSFFSAARGIKAVMMSLNIVFDVAEERNFFAFNALAILMTIAVIIGFAAAIAAIVIVPLVFEFVGLGQVLEPLIGIARWPIMFAGAWAGISLLYWIAPNRDEAHWKWISPGAAAAVILWLIASVFFSVYVQNFARFNEVYGSLGAVIALLMWFWVSAFVFLVGAEMESEMETQLHANTQDELEPEEKEDWQPDDNGADS